MKKQKIEIQLNTRIKLDHLTFGWMCPLCENIYSPYLSQCPHSHKISDTKTSTWESEKPVEVKTKEDSK